MIGRMAPAIAWSLALHAALLGLRNDAFPRPCQDCGRRIGDHGSPSLSVTLRQGKPGPSTFVERARPSAHRQETGSTGTPSMISIGVGQPYYGPTELTRHARAIGDIGPLPDELERDSASGRLVLLLRISAAGIVDEVETNESTLSDVISEAFRERFRKLRFHPGEIDGVAVNSRMRIEVILAPPPKA